ncbi:hypothetical protein DSL92_01950 [Billgrantia gudaonensis]|uniref:Uncharacterized protein n=1 Tax=Billgrantia gudaonensis TaxID=376427 RepID=A0A3S0QS64_9GAMM|nr:hypothetical protein DSL92_01950 [Halomonas gudaonensis]
MSGTQFAGYHDGECRCRTDSSVAASKLSSRIYPFWKRWERQGEALASVDRRPLPRAAASACDPRISPLPVIWRHWRCGRIAWARNGKSRRSTTVGVRTRLEARVLAYDRTLCSVRGARSGSRPQRPMPLSCWFAARRARSPSP